MSKVSVIILTFNEQRNLAAALDSVKGWALEVFVVDSYSTDRTVEIALERAADNVYVVQHGFKNYSVQWNWAITHLPIKSKWTLQLDADERVTDSFKKEVESSIGSASADLEGLYVRRLFYFMGKALRWGGASSNYALRLWRTGQVRFENRSVNEHALVSGHTRALQSFIDHFDYKSLADWLDKHNRYSSLEVLDIIAGNVTGDIKPRVWGRPDELRMFLKKVFFKIPFRHLLLFFYYYIFRLGVLDGKPGFQYCVLRISHLYWIALKRQEYLKTGIPPQVLWPLRGQPHPSVFHSELQRYVDGF